MTRKRKTTNNPFGIKGFNSNNPLGIKTNSNIFGSKRNSKPFGINTNNFGIKMPKTPDPFKGIERANRAYDRRLSRDMRSLTPKVQPLPKITLPKIEPMRSGIFVPRPAERILQPRASDRIIIERRPDKPIYLGKQYDSLPTIYDIVQNVKRRIAEYQEQMKRVESERRTRLQTRQPTVIVQHVPVYNPLEESISRINEELAEHGKEMRELQDEVKKATGDITELKEEVTMLQNYDHELMLEITRLLKIKNENGENTPSYVNELFTQLLEQKRTTDKQIEELKVKLEGLTEEQKKIAEQQEKDVPFNQSLRRLLDDARHDDRVL